MNVQLELIEYTHEKPQYDPFEVFKPTKTFLREVIKQLKEQCYEIIKKKRDPDYEVVRTILDREQERLIRLIKNYEYRLKYPKNRVAAGRITDSDIKAAKAVPIRSFYNGRLVKTGTRFKGSCPFHKERSASFVIYPTNDFHCFGCQANGDVITFIEKTHNLKFIEAVKFLIQK